MRKLATTTAVLLTVTLCTAQYSAVPVNSQQVRKELGPVAADLAGNTIITGSFTTTITLGGFTLSNTNGYDQAFAAKKLPDGSFAWAKMLVPVSVSGTTSNASIYDVCTDGAGNVYITGRYIGKISFAGNITLSSSKNGAAYTDDIFTAKISAAGTTVWAKSAGTSNDGCNAGELGKSITTDNLGNVYVTGQKVWKVFKNTTVCNDIPGGPLCTNATSKSITCPFVLKYDAAGNKIWETNYVNNGAQVSTSCWYNHPAGSNIGSDGTYIYVTGYIYGTVNFGDGALSTGSETKSNTFLLKLNAAGTTLWSRLVTGNANNPFGVGRGLFIAGNDIYISGIGENITFGSCTLPAGGGPPSFLAKYSSTGTCQWAVKPMGISYGSVLHPNGNLASLIRRGASQPMRFDIKEFSPGDGTAVDSTCFLEADTATGSITGYPSIVQTPDGFVFSQMVTGTYHFGDLTITASIPKGAGWPDMMLITYTTPAPPVSRRGHVTPESYLSHILVYPNPVSNQLTIRNKDLKMLGTVSMYDISGQLIYKKITGSPEARIDVKNLPAGVYYIRSDQAQAAIKFIKQ